MKTSNFSRSTRLSGAIGISIYHPRWAKALNQYQPLCPYPGDLDAYKNGSLSEEDYTKRFKEKLSQLDAKVIWKELHQ